MIHIQVPMEEQATALFKKEVDGVRQKLRERVQAIAGDITLPPEIAVLPEVLAEDTCAFLSDVENTLFRSDANISDFQYAEWKSKSTSLSSSWLKHATSTKGGRS